MSESTGRVPFHCECCDGSCVEKLLISPREYDRVLEQRFRFVVLPGHESGDVEIVVERKDEYFVVEKVGEAREQLERDHPQRRHRTPRLDETPKRRVANDIVHDLAINE